MTPIKRPAELRPIPGYEDRYAVTRNGQVWSYRQGRWLKWHIKKNGYAQVSLLASPPRAVHQLVMTTWGPPRPSPRHQINHRDHDKQHNHIDNLEWVTPRENLLHRSNTVNPATSEHLRRLIAATGSDRRELARLLGYRSHGSLNQVVAGKQVLPKAKAAWLESYAQMRASHAKAEQDWLKKHPCPQGLS